MLESRECSTATAAERESSTSLDPLPLTITIKKRIKNKRRFNDEQIRSLEYMFESETKLEPRKKLQMAKELGLQPRQVAIWFQNRRARWKSKQLERDYSILRANYDTLASRFETLQKEKQSLLLQLNKLSDLLEKPQEESRCCGSDVAGNSSTDGDSDHGDGKRESEVKPINFMDGTNHKMRMCSDDDNSNIIGYFGQEEETDLLNMAEPADGSLTSPEKWCDYDSCGLFDQSCSASQWWDFWN